MPGNVALQAKPPEQGRQVQFPAAAADVELHKAEMPSSLRARLHLRLQLERELLAATEERECIVHGPGSVETSVGNMTEMLVGRALAMNPIRDFGDIGAALLNDHKPVWTVPSCPFGPIGITAGLIGFIAAAAMNMEFGHAILFSIACGAPLFIVTLAARTAFNLAAGVAAAVASPFLYAGAFFRDRAGCRGLAAAKRFLRDLDDSLLTADERKEAMNTRAEMLGNAIKAREETLSALESNDTRPYRVRKGDRERIAKRYLNPSEFEQ